MIKPIEGASKGATLKFNFVGKQVNFDVVIPAGYSEKVVVKGSQEIYNTKFANFVVKSSDEVNLKLLDSMLVPLHEILNFVIGPVSILNVNGVGNIDITVKGNRKNPHIWGLFNIKNGTLWFTMSLIHQRNSHIFVGRYTTKWQKARMKSVRPPRLPTKYLQCQTIWAK